MFGISPPPPPQVTAPVAAALSVGCLLVGALILIWGRHLGRAFLCGSGVAAGLVIAERLARSFGWELLIVRLVSAVVLAVLALASARMIWGLLGGLVFGTLAEMILLTRVMDQLTVDQQPVFQPFDATLSGWFCAVGEFLLDGLTGLCQWNLLMVLATVGSAGGVPLAISLVRDRLGRIFMTSLTGSAGIIVGTTIVLGRVNESLWGGFWGHWYLPVGAVGILTTMGIVFQYRGAIAEDRSEEKREAEPPDQKQQRPEKRSRKQ